MSEILSIADENHSPLHIIIPDKNVGITDEEMEMVDNFIGQTLYSIKS